MCDFARTVTGLHVISERSRPACQDSIGVKLT